MVKGTRCSSWPVLESNFCTALLRANQMPPSGPIEKLPTPGVFSRSSPGIGILMKLLLGGSYRTTVCAQFSDIHNIVSVDRHAVGAGQDAGRRRRHFVLGDDSGARI